MKTRIKGNWKTKQVWIDGEALNNKSDDQEVDKCSGEYDWGRESSGQNYLVLRICMICSEKTGIIKLDGYEEIKDIVVSLPQSDFDVEIEP